VYVKSRMALFQKKDSNEKIRNICGIYGIKDSEKVKDPDRYGVDVRLMDTTIQMKISNSIEDRIGTKPSTETVELLIRGLAGCDNRQDFYIFCLRNLGETAGYYFYKKVRSSFEEMTLYGDNSKVIR